MRSLIYVLISFLSVLSLHGESVKTIHVTLPGSLEEQVNIDDQSKITELTVAGKLNAVDIAFIRDNIKLLAVLDLSGAQITAYTGTDGTYKGELINYPANELPHYAFYNPVLLTYKSSLTNVILPADINSIGYLAFYYCWNLTSIQIPTNVSNIYDYSFYGCYSLQNITVSLLNQQYSSIDGVLYNKKQDILLVCPNAKAGYLNIPSTVKHILKSAFENCFNLSAISLPSSVQSIDDYAFAKCSGITGNLKIPNQVKSLGEGAFYGCYNLRGAVTIPASLTDIGSFCFLESNEINSYVVDENNSRFSGKNDMLMSKNQDTLYICPPAKAGSISIPTSVRLIGSHAFYNCTQLTGSIHIPQFVDYIGYYAFLGCIGINNYTVDLQNQYFASDNGVLYDKNRERLVVCPPATSGSFLLPSNLESIDPGAFNNCKNITGYIRFPASFEYLGEFTFYNCSGISGFQVDEANPYFSAIDGVLFSKNRDYIYLSYMGLDGSYTIPSTVKEIGYSAFDGCNKLTQIEIPSSVLAIGSYAFEYCNSLQKVSIGENTDYIGSGAFYGCEKLHDLRISCSSPPIIDYFTFENAELETSTLTVTPGSKTLYEKAPYWSDFKNIAEDQFNSVLHKRSDFPYSITKTRRGILINHLTPSSMIEIYSSSGILIKKEIATSDRVTVHFPGRGIFIVKIDNFTEKIIL